MININNFIGKKQIKENLNIFINAAKKNNKTLDHILIYGQPGMGKTSLAKIIAKELNTEIKIIQGPEIQNRLDIINAIYFLQEGNILFIDEIHSINKSCFEILYSLMDDFKININIGKEGNKKITSIDVPKFTLIVATTILGNLPTPFEDRFGININLSNYSNEEIIEILHNINISKNISYEDIEYIALRSKGVPRIAIKILNRVLDFKESGNFNISEILKKLNIHENGINDIDLSYLKLLFQNGQLSLKTISQTLFIDEKTIISKIEPYLFKIKFITKNNKGRDITFKCRKFLERNNII